jgi:hypothetical protein
VLREQGNHFGVMNLGSRCFIAVQGNDQKKTSKRSLRSWFTIALSWEALANKLALTHNLSAIALAQKAIANKF